MKIDEFVKDNKVKAVIEEIMKHDINHDIVSIGLPFSHINKTHEIITGNGDIYLFIFVKESESEELSRFVFDYEEEVKNEKNMFHLVDEYDSPERTPCYPIYIP